MKLSNDQKLILILGALGMTAILAVHASEWVLYLTQPAKAPLVVTLIGALASLVLLAWTFFVGYVFVRVLWNSVT